VAVRRPGAVRRLPGQPAAQSAANRIGQISLGAKRTGKRSAGKPPAPFDVAGAGNGGTVGLVRHSQRKRGVTDRPDLRPTAPVLDPTCVQERLMCPAGDRPAGVRIGSPVAWRAGRRETDGPEAPRQPHLEGERELSGRNDGEREVAPSVHSPGGRARNCRAKAARHAAGRLTRWVAPAGWLATAR